MKLALKSAPTRPGASVRAFTMVELALCIAIIAIAMTAIIGVLPAGLGVQRQNREETIINQDASVLIEALRNGALNLDDLTNYVDYISVVRFSQNDSRNTAITNAFAGVWYTNSVPQTPGTLLRTPTQILGLLSLPKYDVLNGQAEYTNYVVAQFRSFSGALNDKVYPTSPTASPDQTALSSAFRYLVSIEITPSVTQPFIPYRSTNDVTADVILQDKKVNVMSATLYDVSLLFQWPVFSVGNQFPAKAGNSSRTFRTKVAGQLLPMTQVQNGALVHTNIPGTTIAPRRFVPGLASTPGPIL